MHKNLDDNKSKIEVLAQYIRESKNIVAFTGAGCSAKAAKEKRPTCFALSQDVWPAQNMPPISMALSVLKNTKHHRDIVPAP